MPEELQNPSYEQVGSNNTGHAEAIAVTMTQKLFLSRN
jgi:peptide methionine sulfoxide reductase MsrA